MGIPPVKSTRWQRPTSCYITFSENIARFHELDSIPVALDIRQLDEGNGVIGLYPRRTTACKMTQVLPYLNEFFRHEMRTRGAHLHCLRMASYAKAKSPIFLTASVAVLTVECRTDVQDSDAIVLVGAALVKPVACELLDI